MNRVAKTIDARARLTYHTCENIIAHENNYEGIQTIRGKFVLMPKRLSEFV